MAAATPVRRRCGKRQGLLLVCMRPTTT